MKTPLLTAVLLTGIYNANASNIAFVSFHTGDDTPSAGAAGAGLTSAADVGYTNVLEAAGHTVTRYLTGDDPDAAAAAAYNAADLVIISRSVNSGHYQQEAGFWNTTITSPVMILGGYLLRDSRLGFTSGGTMPDTTGSVSLTITGDGSHPIFDGVTLNGTGGIDYAVNVEEPLLGTPTQRGISINDDPAVGGTVLATVEGLTNGLAIGEWNAGDVLGNGNVLAGNRLVFLTGSREADGISSETAGIYDLTPQGEQMFLNAVDYIAVPEPGSAALSAIGCFFLMVGLRRRK